MTHLSLWVLNFLKLAFATNFLCFWCSQLKIFSDHSQKTSKTTLRVSAADPFNLLDVSFVLHPRSQVPQVWKCSIIITNTWTIPKKISYLHVTWAKFRHSLILSFNTRCSWHWLTGYLKIQIEMWENVAKSQEDVYYSTSHVFSVILTVWPWLVPLPAAVMWIPFVPPLSMLLFLSYSCLVSLQQIKHNAPIHPHQNAWFASRRCKHCQLLSSPLHSTLVITFSLVNI